MTILTEIYLTVNVVQINFINNFAYYFFLFFQPQTANVRTSLHTNPHAASRRHQSSMGRMPVFGAFFGVRKTCEASLEFLREAAFAARG